MSQALNVTCKPPRGSWPKSPDGCGRPHEALHLARSVLESRDRLTPRIRTLFLVREARALAQGGDERALSLFDQARSHYEDGVRDSDPKTATAPRYLRGR